MGRQGAHEMRIMRPLSCGSHIRAIAVVHARYVRIPLAVVIAVLLVASVMVGVTALLTSRPPAASTLQPITVPTRAAAPPPAPGASLDPAPAPRDPDGVVAPPPALDEDDDDLDDDGSDDDD